MANLANFDLPADVWSDVASVGGITFVAGTTYTIQVRRDSYYIISSTAPSDTTDGGFWVKENDISKYQHVDGVKLYIKPILNFGTCNIAQ